MLWIHATYKQDQWDEYLPAAEFAYNNSKQASTGFTPFELDTGCHPITPAASIVPTKVPAANEYVEHWNYIMKAAREALEQAQERQKKYADQHRRHIEFKVGDEVLLSAKNINTPVDRHRPTQKLVPKFIGPYRIAKVISPTAYKLELPPSFKIHPVFHVSLLKQYNRQNNYPIPQPPPPEIINGQQEWEVEEILDKKTI